MNGIGPNDFMMGVLVYFVAWLFIFRSASGFAHSTLRHELTHAFSQLTLHRVKGLKVTGYEGGHITYSGGMELAVDFALLCPDDVLSPLACSSLAGAYTSLRVHPGVMSYHITSTYLETHEAQPTFKRPERSSLGAFAKRESSIVYLCLRLERRRIRHGNVIAVFEASFNYYWIGE